MAWSIAPPKLEGGLSQHQASVRREAVHIRASRFELIKMVQTFLRIGTEWETSQEASDDSCFHGCRFIRRRDRHAAVSCTELPARTAAMPSLQEIHTAAGVNKLPIEEIEDMSLVYSTVTTR